MLNLKAAIPIIQLFNSTFYISVFNVKATLKILQGTHVKMCNQRNCNRNVELKPNLFRSPLIKLKNRSLLSKHPIKDADFFLILRYIK